MTKTVIHVGVGVVRPALVQRVPRRQRRRRHDRGRRAGRRRPEALELRPQGAGAAGGAPATPMRARAFAAHKADFCTVVVPPELPRGDHRPRDRARPRHPLREADRRHDGRAALRIARKVRAAGRKMAVTMSHRFDQDKTTLRAHRPLRRARPRQRVGCRYSCATCASTWPGARCSGTRCRTRC